MVVAGHSYRCVEKDVDKSPGMKLFHESIKEGSSEFDQNFPEWDNVNGVGSVDLISHALLTHKSQEIK
jgi:hypothetical protein